MTAFSSFPRKNKRGYYEFLEVNLRPKPFRDAWRGSGSSGFFGLSRLFIWFDDERDKKAPRTRETASESPLTPQRSHRPAKPEKLE